MTRLPKADTTPSTRVSSGPCSPSLSHELCRPLVSLRAGFDLLLEDDCTTVSVEQRGHLLTMVSLCDDLLRLHAGYLDYASLVSGSRTPFYWVLLSRCHHPGDRSPVPALRSANGLTWEAVAADPGPQVITDASLCQQIFGNLVSNAIKYTPAGGHVRVECQADADEWYLAVSDDGPGIPPESLDRSSSRSFACHVTSTRASRATAWDFPSAVS